MNGQMPKEILRSLIESFGLGKKPIFVQVATESSEGPNLRTMKLFDWVKGTLILVSNTETQKWADLQKHDVLSLLLYSSVANIQITVKGIAHLLTLESHEQRINESWSKVRSDVKKVYVKDRDENMSLVPKNFGIIEVHPRSWEILCLNDHDYLKSTRVIYQLVQERWEKKTLCVES